MWWIIGIVALVLLFFLWMIVHSANQSIDDDTQAMLDEEQTEAVAEYMKKKEKRKGKR
jgi:cytoskeletal protein RodZ